MPGPIPKDVKLRQRKNKSSSRAILPAEEKPIKGTPRLPGNSKDYHPMARRWWSDVWSGPQRQEYLRADLPSLFRLVRLVDIFWKTDDLSIAAEIRLLEREFGLTPLSRRRLEWSVVTVEEKKTSVERKRNRQAITVNDPRGILT